MSGRILIVDDVATNRIVLKGKLSAACYRVLQAETGRVALRIAEREAPELILLDLELNDTDGVAVCGRPRANPATRTIPIVMLTASSDLADRLRALAAGVDDFLTRPVDEPLLLARLGSLLRARETEAVLSLREMTGHELGFAEDAPAFEGPALIAFVAARRADAMA